jgi:hypothetical protein
VLIASEAILTSWSARSAGVGEVFGVNDADPLSAVETVALRQPQIVVIEQGFSTTQRGATLVRRLQTDPAFHKIEVRLLSAERAAHVSHPGTAASLVAITQPIESMYRLARRTRRWSVSEDAKAEINGQVVTLVDISASGAQILCPVVIRPSQRVRASFGDSVRIDAKVAWVHFELSHASAAPRYRAGIEFLNPDAKTMADVFLRANIATTTSIEG